MTRLFLAAGVAALAISSAAAAKPGNGQGGGGQQAEQRQGKGNGGGHGGGGGGGNPHFQASPGGGGRGHGGGGFARPQFQAFQGGGGRGHGHGGGGFAAPQMQRFAMPRQHGGGRGFAFQRAERQQFRMERQAQNRGFERQQMRVQREAQNRGLERRQMRMQRQAQNQRFERQQFRANRMQQAQNRMFERQQLRANRIAHVQGQIAARQQFRMNNVNTRMATNNGVGFGVGGCPPGLISKGCMPPGLARQQGLQVLQGVRQMPVPDRIAILRNLGDARFAPFDIAPGAQILDPFAANALIGVPFTSAATVAALSPLPADMAFLFPATPDTFFQFGDGFAFQVDRNTQLIDALVPLFAGGFVPGSFLPPPFMNSFVPASFGFDAFYPDYGDVCNRYANGVVYEVDCYTGMVEDVIPLYASGYGVGQILPTSYAYYNVPYQYRRLYYDTPNYNYWYAPGAIYQYDPRSSMITSVAALLSPGFAVGQPLPVGYDVYNVPYDYRATYYDTPSAWYRYSNGYIYQVDPVTRLVTAIVASLLT